MLIKQYGGFFICGEFWLKPTRGYDYPSHKWDGNELMKLLQISSTIENDLLFIASYPSHEWDGNEWKLLQISPTIEMPYYSLPLASANGIKIIS